MIQRLLKSWKKQIPAMSCEPGCRECCEGDARTMTLSEWREIRHPGKYATGPALAACPFLGEFGCEIYTRRPLICRLFGVVAPDDQALVELAGTFPISCPRGHCPEAPLPLAEALRMQVVYQDFANRELQQAIGDWNRYLSAGGDAGVTALPEKFQWLRYVLSTREGQSTLRLLWGQTPVQIDPEKMAQMTAMLGG
ncbi:MAG: YkgJ family cysteine cluster protein [Deltaproteobacteria bacterium]|nr:YkgJ family cysteine cluster protein [Deltaproteobacteria bacterium]